MNEAKRTESHRLRVDVKIEPAAMRSPSAPADAGCQGMSEQQHSLPTYADALDYQLQPRATYIEKQESALSAPGGSSYNRNDSYPSYSPGSGNSLTMPPPVNNNDGDSPGPDVNREESPPPPPRVYKPCVVCSDKSSGYHYGVSSCEGCKGFFRRSVQKNMQYSCQKDGSCEINKTTRNRCQHCRLKKCFEKGMSKEAVRNDRNKKRKKDDDGDSAGSGSKDQPAEPANCHMTESDREIINLVLRAHTGTMPGSPTLLAPVRTSQDLFCTGTQQSSKVSVTSFEHTAVGDSPGMAALFSESLSATSCSSPAISSGMQSPAAADSPLTANVKTVVWESVKELSSEGIVKVVDFAKLVPSFTTLPISDQITLLKAACLEIMILRLCMRYSKDCNSLAFTNGAMVTREELDAGGFGPLAHSVFDFAQALYNLNLDETEFALLSAICLISGDRYGLEDPLKVEKLQEKFIDALRHYLLGHRPHEHLLFAKLLMKVTDLRSISVKGAERVLHLRMEATHDIPPLVAEMLHRTENVCIP